MICGAGNRRRQAREKFLEAGITNVVNVEGGTRGWERTGLPA